MLLILMMLGMANFLSNAEKMLNHVEPTANYLWVVIMNWIWELKELATNKELFLKIQKGIQDISEHFWALLSVLQTTDKKLYWKK